MGAASARVGESLPAARHPSLMKPRRPPFVSPVTVERRTVLRWLGNSSVLALGGHFLSACFGESLAHGPRSEDAGAGSGASDVASTDVASTPGFAFQPGPNEGDLFTPWFENTVDPQNLADILASWKLTVDGMARNPLVLGFADLIALDRQDQVTDFHCVEGWSVYDVPWNGVLLTSLLDLAGTETAATHVTFYSIGGEYSESLPITVAREPRTLLGYGVSGSTLPLAHGFPLRLVVPRLLGYKNAKYLSRIEVTDHPVTGFWESYGYSYDGEVPEGRLRPGKY
jgi:DMSO/TMAO reductase YedYZ molybdopterin-dependent catalytic subunit